MKLFRYINILCLSLLLGACTENVDDYNLVHSNNPINRHHFAIQRVHYEVIGGQAQRRNKGCKKTKIKAQKWGRAVCLG